MHKGKAMGEADLEDGLYYLWVGNMKAEAEVMKVAKNERKGTVDTLLMHCCMGHIGNHTLTLVDSDTTTGTVIDCQALPTNCPTCTEGKQKRIPFPKESQTTTQAPLELIHSDLCSPMSVNSIGGHHYFNLWIDDYLYFMTIFLCHMKEKEEILDNLRTFKACAENQTD
ncbi:hypothetical protein FRB93_011887 [Tulasnella sp. JGI-2019a]|nr:hypothetical protein FRB93_011887 [Tulasnella sp. JGI-2019a]